jgi:hypothetical protein
VSPVLPPTALAAATVEALGASAEAPLVVAGSEAADGCSWLPPEPSPPLSVPVPVVSGSEATDTCWPPPEPEPAPAPMLVADTVEDGEESDGAARGSDDSKGGTTDGAAGGDTATTREGDSWSLGGVVEGSADGASGCGVAGSCVSGGRNDARLGGDTAATRVGEASPTGGTDTTALSLGEGEGEMGGCCAAPSVATGTPPVAVFVGGACAAPVPADTGDGCVAPPSPLPLDEADGCAATADTAGNDDGTPTPTPCDGPAGDPLAPGAATGDTAGACVWGPTTTEVADGACAWPPPFPALELDGTPAGDGSTITGLAEGLACAGCEAVALAAPPSDDAVARATSVGDAAAGAVGDGFLTATLASQPLE